MNRIKTTLPFYCQDVVWIDRLQAGKVKIGSNYIQMCKAGTPDLYAILKTGHMVFIECKTLKGRQTEEQKKFEYMLMGINNIHYVLARVMRDAVDFINNLKK